MRFTTALYGLAVCAVGLIDDARYLTLSDAFVSFRSLDAQVLKHERTGAKVVLLVPRDPTEERTFSVSFRTPVTNDKGISHIIEHSVFEGSRRYPVMNSIQHLSKNSMSTYINAHTAPITTGYPVSTINDQDLINLATVYLDNVFDPLFVENRVLFDREGWHYESESAAGPLSFGGVVLNEMKGVFSNPRRLAGLQLTKDLYRNSSYEHYSGGVPTDIPDLTFQEAVDFYHRHYHPANSYTFYYGSQDQLPQILDLIDFYSNLASDRFRKLYGNVSLDEIEEGTRVAQPDVNDVYVSVSEISVPSQGDDQPTSEILYSTMHRLTAELDECTIAGIDLLSTLFASDKSSPLREALEASEVGGAVAAGYDTSYPAVGFRVSIQGIPSTWVPRMAGKEVAASDWLESMLNNVTEQVIIDKGFSRDRISAAMTKLEFTVRKAEANPVNVGMAIMDDVVDAWVEGQDPLRSLRIGEVMDCLRTNVKSDPDFFVNLLRQYHPVKNVRRAYVIAKEDDDAVKMRNLAERTKLTAIEGGMDAEEKKRLFEYSKFLRAIVEQGDTAEQIATLPVLPLSSVARAAEARPFSVEKVRSDVPVVLAAYPTGQIGFVSIYLDLADLTIQELHLMPLINELLNYAPSSKRSAEEVRILLDRSTGGLNFDWKFESGRAVAGVVGDPSKAFSTGILSFSCLKENAAECVGVVDEVVTSPPFELGGDRAKVFWKRRAQYVKNLALQDPRGAASSKVYSYATLASAAHEQLNGLSAVTAINRTLGLIESDWPHVARRLKSIWQKVFVQNRMAILITGDKETLRVMKDAIDRSLLPSVPRNFLAVHSGSKSWDIDTGRQEVGNKWESDLGDIERLDNKSISDSIDAGSLVNYNHQLVRLQNPGEISRIEWEIPIRVITDKYLVPTVRMIRGAYGVGANYMSKQGLLALSSYRDPLKEETYQAYEEIPRALQKITESMEDRDLESYLIRKLANRPESSTKKGAETFGYWSRGITDDFRQRQRNRYFEISKKDFNEVQGVLQRAFDDMMTKGSAKVSLG